MKIKKYVANNISEAVCQIKRELGSEAVIVSNRKIRQPGWKGFLGARLWEVTAALDQPASISPVIPPEIIEQQGILHKEITEIKELLQQYPLKKQTSAVPGFSRNRTLGQWAEKLTQRGISPEITKQLLTDIKADLEAGGNKKNKIEPLLEEKIENLLEPIYLQGDKGRIIVFVGPTGVGKTTTMAKLAAQFSLEKGKKVGLITIDTYRIGAVEQLRIYGDIMGLPVSVVNTPGELASLIDEMGDKDVIFIDTAGRSYKNDMPIRELRAFLMKVPQAEICLVLSSTTKSTDLNHSVDIFSMLAFNRIIFTKIDETSILGDILNISIKTGVPVSHISNGQNVPQDIMVVEPRILSKLILEGADNYGSGS